MKITRSVPGESDKTRKEKSDSRPLRADAQRNVDTLLRAAMEVFMTSGVEAPVREIAEKAGVGIGTLYRHFPERSDLIVAVFRNEVDACATAATTLAAQYEPGEALEKWMQRYVGFISAKRGLAAALHSGDPAYAALPDYFDSHLRPALQTLLNAAATSGEIRPAVNPDDLLWAVAGLCIAAREPQSDYTRRMVALLVDGLRYGANSN